MKLMSRCALGVEDLVSASSKRLPAVGDEIDALAYGAADTLTDIVELPRSLLPARMTQGT
jgi:hypothetical protein